LQVKRATLPQKEQVLNLFAQKKPTSLQMQRLFSSGTLSLLAEAAVKVNLEELDPFRLAAALGLPDPGLVPYGQKYELVVDNISPFNDWNDWGLDTAIRTYGPDRIKVRLYSLNCGALARGPIILAKHKLIGCNQAELKAFQHLQLLVRNLFVNPYVIGLGAKGKSTAPPKYWEFPVLDYTSCRENSQTCFRGDALVNNRDHGKWLFLARPAASKLELDDYITNFVDPTNWKEFWSEDQIRSKPAKSNCIH
jgi:hypothetical protein